MTLTPWRTPADGPRWLYAEPGRLRAVWRLAVFGFAVFMFQPIASSLIAPLFGVLSRAVGEPVPAYPWITLATVTSALLLAGRLVDETPWDALGLGKAAWRLPAIGGGAAIGAGVLAATMLLLWVAGSVQVQQAGTSILGGGSPWGASALRLAVLLAPSALWEELVFRGYLWTVARDAGGIHLARWSTAVAFGVIHLMNAGSGVQTTILVVVAGLGLAVLRERTDSVMAAFAAHFLWNWCMAAVLHVAVSGIVFETPGYRTVLTGPAWWTGGAWGPEGSLAALLVLGAALGIAFGMARTPHGTRIGDYLKRRQRGDDG